MIETDCIQLRIYGTVFLTYLETASATEIALLQQEVWEHGWRLWLITMILARFNLPTAALWRIRVFSPFGECLPTFRRNLRPWYHQPLPVWHSSWTSLPLKTKTLCYKRRKSLTYRHTVTSCKTPHLWYFPVVTEWNSENKIQIH
jgi:hypothetical protein